MRSYKFTIDESVRKTLLCVALLIAAISMALCDESGLALLFGIVAVLVIA